MGEPLKITVNLKSTGSAPVVVSSRLALNSRDAPDPMREIVFDVKGPDGALLPFNAKLKIGGASPEQTKKLGPGESVSHEYDLPFFFDLGKPGEYRVSALYSSAPLARPDGEQVWTELI